MKYLFFYNTELGRIGIAEENSFITNIYFSPENMPEEAIIYETTLIKEARKQLAEYLESRRKYFDLPLAPKAQSFS